MLIKLWRCYGHPITVQEQICNLIEYNFILGDYNKQIYDAYLCVNMQVLEDVMSVESMGLQATLVKNDM